MSTKQGGDPTASSKYGWQETVRDVFQASPTSLPAKLNAAHKAILARLDDSELGVNERTAIKDTLSILRILASGVRVNVPGTAPRDNVA